MDGKASLSDKKIHIKSTEIHPVSEPKEQEDKKSAVLAANSVSGFRKQPGKKENTPDYKNTDRQTRQEKMKSGQETEFIRQSFLALLGSGGGWTFASTLVFHKEDISYSVEDKETQTYPWRVIRDILARVIELDQYPESSSNLSAEELSQFSWLQNLVSQYRDLLEQVGEEPAVVIPYLSKEAEVEKEAGETEDTGEETREAQSDERSGRLNAVFREAANAFALHSMALIPSKPLIQRFFEKAGEKEKQEFLLEILKVQSKRDYGKSALNTIWGLIHYTYGESGAVEFRLVNGENEGHGAFTMQEVSRAIQAAIDVGEYLPPGEYEAARKEEFALCPEETFQLYKEMSNRNQNVIQVSDIFCITEKINHLLWR